MGDDAQRLPPYTTVYTYYDQWNQDGHWQVINARLVAKGRTRSSTQPERSRQPPPLSQRGPVSEDGRKRGGDTGFDGNKKVKGRKRHLMVDTLGLILKVFVGAANTGDREGLAALAMSMKNRLPRLKKILVVQSYTGKMGEAVKNGCSWEVEVSKRESEHKGFAPEFKRWVIERTFGWLLHERRLSKDYEQWPESSESMIYLANIRLSLRRLMAPAPA